MKNTITITSKGQTTIPVDIRRKLDLEKNGGVLQISFNDDRCELVISKQTNIDELSKRISSYVSPETNPVINVDEYYQTHRGISS